MKEKMKRMILNLIKEKKGSVSFAEIENMLDKYDIEYNGDNVVGPSSYKTIYYWLSFSQLQ